AAPRPRHPLAPTGERGAGARGRRAHDVAAGGGCRGARRPADLRHLLERAGGERADRRRLRRADAGIRPGPRRRSGASSLRFARRCWRLPPNRTASASTRVVLRRRFRAARVARRLQPGVGAVVPSLTPMALKTRVWSAGKLVLLAAALVATYLIFAAAAMRIAIGTREVEVQDFTNRTSIEATAVAYLTGRSHMNALAR